MEKHFPKLIPLLVPLFYLSGCASLISPRQPEIDVKQKYAAEQLPGDLDFLFQTFEDVHPNLYVYSIVRRVLLIQCVLLSTKNWDNP